MRGAGVGWWGVGGCWVGGAAVERFYFHFGAETHQPNSVLFVPFGTDSRISGSGALGFICSSSFLSNSIAFKGELAAGGGLSRCRFLEIGRGKWPPTRFIIFLIRPVLRQHP